MMVIHTQGVVFQAIGLILWKGSGCSVDCFPKAVAKCALIRRSKEGMSGNRTGPENKRRYPSLRKNSTPGDSGQVENELLQISTENNKK